MTSDGWLTFGVRGEWELQGLGATAFVEARNLTDEVYRNHLSRIKELMPEQGRSINLVYRAAF